MDREAGWATVHRIAKSWTQLKQLSSARGSKEGTVAEFFRLEHASKSLGQL